jgi:hypothetical protein
VVSAGESEPALGQLALVFGLLRAVFVFNNPAVEEVHGPLGVPRESRIVGDHADGRATLVQLSQQAHDCLAILRVEVTSGLVREENERVASDRARDGDALLLTAG